jgi:hypothetical protein
MKTFKQFNQEPPGAGYFGTNELRKKYVADTPGQVDPVKIEKPTPSVHDKEKKKPK